MVSTKYVLVLIAFAFTVIAGKLSAQSITLSEDDGDEWQYSLTAYAFVPLETSGTSEIADTEVELDLGISEVFEVLDFTLAGRGEAWRGDWGVIADFYTVKLGPGGTLQSPGGGSLDVGIDIDQHWVSVLGAYRFSRGTYGPKNRRFSWDASAGIRWNSITQKVSAVANIDIGPSVGVQNSLGGTETWFEPIVGIRGAYEVADKWSVFGRAEIGGFGVEGDNLQYTLVLAADWQVSSAISLSFGYQYYSIDFETERSDGAFVYDISQHGPYLGLTYNF
ncbi:hypothetical protein [Ruegeria conchae]|uniref:Outer membrane protein with beta-barrel domain n=1 Tax=Ruegeria conchae TaxID=981384 RepID=A0A497ZMJ3_9RHOB|nr:hypothetical protein [Ruegeria conchae]RLK07895.1 hypothetical protein CLV75_1558 [Ruegeria conchae]